MQLPTTHLLLLATMAAAASLPAAAQQAGSVQPAPATTGKAQWPVVLPEPPKAEEPPEPGWTQPEIEAARARCSAVISRYRAVAQPVDTIKEGSCGTPAPVEVTGIGGVTFSNPAVMNCELLAALGDWLKQDVQPTARRLLGGPVNRMDVMSSYSCRNAYGRKRNRLSEHALANAIDIGAFKTSADTEASLLADWGMTEREAKEQIAAAEAAAKAHAKAKALADAKAAAEAKATTASKAAAERTRTATAASRESARNQASDAVTGSTDDAIRLKGLVTDTFRQATGAIDAQNPSSLTLEAPSRLGGPKVKRKGEAAAGTTAAAPAPPAKPAKPTADGRRTFLHELHASACRRFGTVLGPEANRAHRNHFHLDLAERPRGNFCE